MKKLLVLLLLTSCGTYHHSPQQIKSLLAITEAGDTIAVPYNKVKRDYERNYNINWDYRINNSIWWNNGWNWNNRFWDIPFYGNFNNTYRSVPLQRQKVEPKRTRPTVIPNLPKRPKPKPRNYNSSSRIPNNAPSISIPKRQVKSNYNTGRKNNN